MMQALTEGVYMGLLLSAMIGPVFFTLIQNSLESGFKYAMVLALGILSSDFLYVIVTYFGISFLAKFPNFEWYLAIFGGVILVGFGISNFWKKVAERPSTGGIPFRKLKKRKAFFKGFSINGINPFVLLFWISIAGLVTIKNDFDKVDIISYYFGILATVFCFDLLKAFIAKKLKRLITPKIMWILNRVVGVLLVFYGFRLFWHAFNL